MTRIYDMAKLQLIELCEKTDNFCVVVVQWTEKHSGKN